ncbi:MAG: tetratricopeptide (TPR) repeat protein [Bacteroidia bacterium]|jgi:tetratricopeptide (TPR) repeat protein
MAKYFKILLVLIGVGLSLSSCQNWLGESSNDPLFNDTTQTLAVQEWSKRINKYPDNDNYRYQRGMELVKDRKLKLALNDINRAIEMNPKNATYVVSRAGVHMGLNETKLALEDYEKAVEIDPTNEEALVKLGQFFLFVRQFENSLGVLKKLEKVNASNPEGHFYQGMSQKENGDTAAAINAFQKATQIELFHYNALFQLGQLYAGQNDTIAITYFRNALLADEFSDEAYYAIGLIYQKMGLKDSAILNYQKTIDINAQHYFAYYNTGYIMLDGNNYDRAIEHFRIAVKFAPEFAKGHYMLGLSHESKELYDMAAAHYTKCLQVDPNFDLAKQALIRIK